MKKLLIASMLASAFLSGHVLADSYICTTSIPLTYVEGKAKPTQEEPDKITTVITENEEQVQLNIGTMQYFYPKVAKNTYSEGKVMVAKYFKNGQIVFGVIESSKDVDKSSTQDLQKAVVFGGCKTGTYA